MDAKMQETRADVELLLECIKCQMTYPEAVRQALVTLASMCSTQENVKDILRERDGLKFIANLLTSGTDMSVKEAAMFSLGCAVESNVFSQKMLCQSSMFVYLHKMLVSRQTSVRPIQAATFLILALTTNNGVGQTLVRQSECLDVLLGLFKSSLPSSAKTRPDETWCENVKPQSVELWTSVTSALSACVNNPQNEENQRMCSIVFPYALHLLQAGTEPYLLRPIASFIGLAVANNVHNQGRVEQCGGLKILINAVHGRMADNSMDLQLAIALTNTIDTVITDHCGNAACCGSLGGIALFLRLLQSDLEPAAYLQIVLTLAHCTDACVSNQQEVVKQGGISVLIQKLTQSRDEALTNAVKYVLQTCVHVDSSFEQPSMTPKRANLKPLQDIVIKSPQERHPERGTVSQFSADEIKQRLDSLEASLLSASARTPSEVYTEPHCSTAARATTRMVAPPTQCDMATGMDTAGNVGRRTETVQHETISTGGVTATFPSARQTDIASHRQIGTSTREDSMCDEDDTLQERTAPIEQHREVDHLDRTLCQLDSGRGRRALHAAQLTAELQRQELDQEKKDSRCEKKAALVRGSVQKLPGQSPAAPVWQRGQEHSSNPTKHHPTVTGGHQTKIGVSATHCQPGTVNRVPPQSNHMVYRLSHPRESGSSKSTSTLLSRCARSSCGKSKTKAPFSSVGPNRKNTVPAKTQTRVAMTSAHVESDDDQVFRKPSLPLRRKARVSCASTGPYEAHKRRLFGDDGNDDMLKLQPVVLLRPLPQQCTAMFTATTDPCPSPARSEFDVKLLQTATEAWVRDSPWTQTGQTRAGRSARVASGQDGGRTHRQTHSDRLHDRGSHNSVVSHGPQSHTSHYTMDSDADSDTNDRTTRVPGTKYCRQKLDNLRCPGCQPPERIQGGSCLLNSYTYNIAVETSSGTCRAHREMRESERRFMHTLKQGLPSGRRSRRLLHKHNRRLEFVKKAEDDSVDVYHFPTEASSSESVSPPGSVVSVASSVASVTRSVTDGRRPRVPYTRLEEDNLTEGVQRFRRSWTQILHSYDFHPSRTAVDLKEKYRRLMAKVEWTPEPADKTAIERRPFSMVEERRLRRGVHQFGYNWKAIHGAFRFAKGRTAIELRNRWRGMHRPR